MKRFYLTLIALFALSAMCVAQNVWNVMLESAGPDKIEVVKVVRNELGLTAGVAKARVDAAPTILLYNVAKEQAEDLAQKLRAVGATVGLLVSINAESFPDESFRSRVSQRYDKDEDGKLSEAEIAAVTDIYVYDTEIQTLKGIEYFTALKSLYCYSCLLTELDVSANIALESLNCHNNKLTTLDVSGCTALKYLRCYNNKLTTLDVSGCTALEILFCSNNQLTALNVTGFTALEMLSCSNNQLTALNVTGCDSLRAVSCYHNRLSGDAMTTLVTSLCDRTEKKRGYIVIFQLKKQSERNVCTTEQVAIAKGKNWRVEAWNAQEDCEEEYAGSEPTAIRTVETSDGTASAAGWYSIDGKKLPAEPTQRGVYIHGGRKVVK